MRRRPAVAPRLADFPHTIRARDHIVNRTLSSRESCRHTVDHENVAEDCVQRMDRALLRESAQLKETRDGLKLGQRKDPNERDEVYDGSNQPRQETDIRGNDAEPPALLVNDSEPASHLPQSRPITALHERFVDDVDEARTTQEKEMWKVLDV